MTIGKGNELFKIPNCNEWKPNLHKILMRFPFIANGLISSGFRYSNQIQQKLGVNTH
jgi:hypothetical protein